MRQPLSVLVYSVRRADRGWEYLLLKRGLNRDRFWQGVSGGVEKGEELAEAAHRELHEETGLMPSRLEEIHYSYSFPVAEEWQEVYAPGTKVILEHVFVAYVEGQVQPILSAEHEEWRWCRFSEALQLLYWSTNKEALKRVDAYLRRG